jgi:WhiB family redox-sensing transcriptional regulator
MTTCNPHWRLDGACRGEDPELWFPDRSNSTKAKQAKAICGRCPVKDPCFQWAADVGVEYGVWGGTTHADRRALGIKVKHIVVFEPPGCGTTGAYDRHIKQGEPVDDACRAANTQRQRETRARAKAKKAAALATAGAA